MMIKRKGEEDTNLAVDFSAYADHNSFEKTYKNSYSHGLEKIYALQNVDLGTVRKIEISSRSPNSDAKIEEELEDASPLQLEFDFSHYDKLEPFILREPIQVLGLATRIESILIAQQKQLIKDLLAGDQYTLAPITGLGFGHLDELQNRLQEHLKGHALDKVHRIDYLSWARTLVGDLDAKKVHLALEPYGLTKLVQLSTAEGIEVRRATGQTRRLWVEEIVDELRSPAKSHQFSEDLRRCTLNFIHPWMHHRHGIASEIELMEYLSAIGTVNTDTDPVLEWMKAIYGRDGQFLLAPYLQAIDDHFYSCSKDIAAKAASVIDVAKSYFYQSHLQYTLPSLTDWILRECAKEWIGFTEGFIEKVLRLSSTFKVRRGACGNLIVKLR